MKAYIVVRETAGVIFPLWAYDNADDALEDIEGDDERKVITVAYYPKKLREFIDRKES